MAYAADRVESGALPPTWIKSSKAPNQLTYLWSNRRSSSSSSISKRRANRPDDSAECAGAGGSGHQIILDFRLPILA